MPSSTPELRAKFMKGESDGIGEAEDIIRKHRGTVVNGVITPPDNLIKDSADAIQYLLEEWDYTLPQIKET